MFSEGTLTHHQINPDKTGYFVRRLTLLSLNLNDDSTGLLPQCEFDRVAARPCEALGKKPAHDFVSLT
jgi:hypothetical protein